MNSYNYQLCVDFINSAKREGVTVQILLLPISNVLFEYMQQFPVHYESFFEVESLIYELAEKTGVFVTGSYYPETLGLTMDSFYDGYHVKSEVIEKLIDPLRVKDG